MILGPSTEQMTIGWPGTEAAIAANGIRLPSTTAKIAARNASDRQVDQVSDTERFTLRL